MKNIIIWGALRSGKSTLAKRINKEFGHHWIEVDPLRNIYDFLNPANPILGLSLPSEEQAKAIAPMLKMYMDRLVGKHQQTFYVFEGVALDMPCLMKYLDTDKYTVICMGWSLPREDKFKQIKRYETKYDWTSRRTDDELRQEIQEGINTCELVKQFAKKNGLPYFDTSENREQVLDEIMKSLYGIFVP